VYHRFDLTKPALHQIEPGGTGGREVQLKFTASEFSKIPVRRLNTLHGVVELRRRTPELVANTVGEIAYAGSRGIHLMFCYNANEIQPDAGSQASRRLIQPLSSVNTILESDPRNMSNFHSLQAKLTRRISRGLQFLGSYTFGKSLDYGGSAASGGGAVGNPQTVTNLRAGYGPSGFDVKHRFVGSWVYELPFGSGKRWLNGESVSRVLRHW